MSHRLQLRPATNADRDGIERLVFGVLREHGLTPDPEGTDADLRDVEAHYFAAGGRFDVLVDETGVVVGSAGIFRLSGTVCDLRKMYLAPAVRGLGYGRKLLEHALAFARESGFRRVTLETASVLQAAITLYERAGFRRFQPDHMAARADAAYFLDLN